MADRDPRPRRERQRSAPAPSEVDRFLAMLQEDYLEPLARGDPPRPPPIETDPPTADVFIHRPSIFHEDDETVVDEPQPRNPFRERGGRERREQPSQPRASVRDTRRSQGGNEQPAHRAQDDRQERQNTRRAQQGAQAQRPQNPQQTQDQPQGHRNPGPEYPGPQYQHPVPHIIQLPYYTPHAPHSGGPGFNVGHGLGVPPPPPRYDPVPVGTYVVRLTRSHGRPIVGIWRASGGGRWTPVINLEGAVGEVVLLPLQEG